MDEGGREREDLTGPDSIYSGLSRIQKIPEIELCGESGTTVETRGIIGWRRKEKEKGGGEVEKGERSTCMYIHTYIKKWRESEKVHIH
jgi:hypothetical protein